MVAYEKDYFTQEGYDQYYDFPAHKIRVEKVISIIHPRSVLDIGCGYGFTVRRFLDSGIYAFGIDISKWCEEKAKQIIPNYFKRWDICKPLPFHNKEFDLIYCMGVLEHIQEDFIDGIFHEFDRVAHKKVLQIAFSTHPDASKTSGHMCLHNAEWWINRMPYHTFLFGQDTGVENGCLWYYKG